MESLTKTCVVMRRKLSKKLGSKQKAEKKVDKITGPKRLEQFVVLADYQAQEKGELDLQTGMVVEVTEKSESGELCVLTRIGLLTLLG